LISVTISILLSDTGFEIDMNDIARNQQQLLAGQGGVYIRYWAASGDEFTPRAGTVGVVGVLLADQIDIVIHDTHSRPSSMANRTRRARFTTVHRTVRHKQIVGFFRELRIINIRTSFGSGLLTEEIDQGVPEGGHRSRSEPLNLTHWCRSP
jgi:hypothetical protein